MLPNICYPVTEILLQSFGSCQHEWVSQKEIGTDGTYGEIWSVCCNKNNRNDCNHVLKYMPYDNGIRMNTRVDIINEINIQNQCASVGLCPSINDAWLCEKGGAFVMELYTLTVKQFLLMYPDIKDKQNILANIVTLIDKLHRYGIYHGDLHLDNIMVNQSDGKTGVKEIIYRFIDFGKGGRFVSMNDPHVYKDYLYVSQHIQDLIDEYPDTNFNELYETMKIYMKKFD